MTKEVMRTINDLFRSIICPTLEKNGFSYIKGKTAWRWNEDTIWVFELSAFGNYLSVSTGWPSSSLRVNLGIFYTFLPHLHQDINKPSINENGLLCPRELSCNSRGQLHCSYNQEKFTKNASRNEKELTRRDAWWVEPDCSNIDEVIIDINQTFINNGLKWYTEKSNKELSLLARDKLKGYIIEEIDY